MKTENNEKSLQYLAQDLATRVIDADDVSAIVLLARYTEGDAGHTETEYMFLPADGLASKGTITDLASALCHAMRRSPAIRAIVSAAEELYTAHDGKDALSAAFAGTDRQTAAK